MRNAYFYIRKITQKPHSLKRGLKKASSGTIAKMGLLVKTVRNTLQCDELAGGQASCMGVGDT